MMLPVYTPGASSVPLTRAVMLAGAIDPDAVAVSHAESVVIVNGTGFPVPIEDTCTVCADGP
jgi:hypothetical protein